MMAAEFLRRNMMVIMINSQLWIKMTRFRCRLSAIVNTDTRR